MLTLARTARAGAATLDCYDQLSANHPRSELQWRQHGLTIERRAVPPGLRNHSLIIRVEERGVSVDVQILDADESVIAQSGSPVERVSVQYLYLPANAAGATLVVRAHDPASFEGKIRVRFLTADVGFVTSRAVDCAAALRKWAQADAAYDRGQSVTAGRVTAADPGVAHAAFQDAASGYQDVLKVLAVPAHAPEDGQLELTLAALYYYALKDWTASASWAKSAAATFSETNEPYRRARAQAIEAAAWIELATRSNAGAQTVQTPVPAKTQLAAARTLLAHLAEFHGARGESYDRALQINNIGVAYVYEGRFEPAIPYYSRALAEFEQLGDNVRAALTLQNFAYLEWGLGRASVALTKFDRALELMGPTARPNLYLMTLNNSGLAHYEAGHFDESLRLQTQALDLATRLQSDQARERSEFGLGVTYYAIGDRALAAQFLRAALEIATADLDPRTRVEALRSLAQIESETGNVAEAIRHDSEALQLATAQSARSRILLRLAEDYSAQGDAAASRTILDGLATHSNGDELVRATAQVRRAHLLRVAGSSQQAERELIQGIRTLDRLDSLAERFDARLELARIYTDQGRTEEALVVLRRALRYSSEIRAQTANPEYRASIVRSLRPAISLQVDLLRAQFSALVQGGHRAAAQALAVESLEAVDRDRALSFQEWRAEYFEQHSNTELAHLLASSSSLYRDMAERRFELGVREDRGGTDDSRARALREDIARLRVRLGLITSEIAARSGGVSGSNGTLDDRAGAASRVEQSLRPEQVVVEYWLGSAHAYAWVITSAGIEWFELPTPENIERAARGLHEAMHSSATDPARRQLACLELYRLVLAPISQSLVGARELIIIPDGSLHYVPFAALRSPMSSDRAYLVQDFDLSVAPALRFLPKSAYASAPDAQGTARMLVVADPIYTAGDSRRDPADRSVGKNQAVRSDRVEVRVPEPVAGLVRLESSEREAAQIRSLFGAEHVDLLQGANATRDAVLARDLGRYQFIHIASHGVIDSEIPQLSALILGTYGSGGPVPDPYLRAADFLTRTFHAQAVVLSACDTALGKEYASEGLVGLRYAALARGARAVVASLWPVTDARAARLMTDMYRGIIASGETGSGHADGGGLAVARALAGAMRAQLVDAPGLDPALWAPFVVYVAGD